MPEPLKPYSEISKPDERWAYFKIDLADLHRFSSELSLPKIVPERVRSVFQQAQHILVFSYFQYSMIAAALIQAHIALEASLRSRWDKEPLPAVPTKKNRKYSEPGLKKLLEHAVERGWITSASDELIAAVPDLRNSLAHGSYILDPSGTIAVLRRCRELIVEVHSERHSGEF